MNRRLADWAGIAEILSGLAIVVTLLFLFFEVRDNTNVMRATAFERNIQSMIDLRFVLAQDPELYAIAMGSLGIGSFDDYQSMSELDQGRADTWNTAVFLMYEKAYYSWQYDLLDTQEYERFIKSACLNLQRIAPETREGIVNTLTVRYVEHLITARECEPVRSWLDSLHGG